MHTFIDMWIAWLWFFSENNFISAWKSGMERYAFWNRSKQNLLTFIIIFLDLTEKYYSITMFGYVYHVFTSFCLIVFIFRLRALWSPVHWMKLRFPHFRLMTSVWWRSVGCSSGGIQQRANRMKTDEEMKAKNILYSDSCPTQVNWSIHIF